MGAVSIAMDSDNAGEGSDDGRPVRLSASLRDSADSAAMFAHSPLARPQNFNNVRAAGATINNSARSVSGQLLRLSVPANRRRNYDENQDQDQDDAESPLFASTDRGLPVNRGT